MRRHGWQTRAHGPRTLARFTAAQAHAQMHTNPSQHPSGEASARRARSDALAGRAGETAPGGARTRHQPAGLERWPCRPGAQGSRQTTGPLNCPPFAPQALPHSNPTPAFSHPVPCHGTCLARSAVRRLRPKNPRSHITFATDFVSDQRTTQHPLCACVGAGAHNRGTGMAISKSNWDDFIVRDLRTLSLNTRDISVRQAPGGSSTPRTDANRQQHLPLGPSQPNT